jgi:hypothetical protein
VYTTVHSLISSAPVKDYVPYSWVSLVLVKREHYSALAHHYVAVGILSQELKQFSQQIKETLQYLHGYSDPKTQLEIRVPQDDAERKLLGEYYPIPVWRNA